MKRAKYVTPKMLRTHLAVLTVTVGLKYVGSRMTARGGIQVLSQGSSTFHFQIRIWDHPVTYMNLEQHGTILTCEASWSPSVPATKRNITTSWV